MPVKNQLQSLRTALQQTVLAARIRQLFEPKRGATPRQAQREFRLEALEPRLLLSADINYADTHVLGADYTLVATDATHVQLKLTGGALVGTPVALDDGVDEQPRLCGGDATAAKD